MRASDLPLYYNAVEILDRNLVAHPDKVALYTEERSVTFSGMAAEASQVGHALAGLGVRSGENVALLCPDSVEWVSSFFGILKLGSVAVSLSTMLKAHELALIFDDCRPSALIVHKALLPLVEPIRHVRGFPARVVVIPGGGGAGDLSFRDLVDAQPTELSAAATHREDFCSLNYSSGTTGQAKGIFHAHKDLPLAAQLWAVNVLGLGEADRTFAAAKLFFTFATGGNLIFPWYVGASAILMAGPPRVPANVLETIQRFRPTIHYNVPTGYAAMLADANFDRYDLSSLRICVSAGEALPSSLWHAWKARTGIDIIDGIGSTENYHIFLSNRPGDIRPGSSGKPFDGYTLKIVDDDGSETPLGQIGNLLVKGETAALSYLHQAQRSRETFLGPWLVTGDKYSLDDDGYYWHAGRSDDMLKVGGIWVSPAEVENTLLSHPAVFECAVVGWEDTAGLIKPKAFVVLRDDHHASDKLAKDLIAYCREQMADYKRPRWVEFVPELPKTATGKLQRFQLRRAVSTTP